MADAALTKSQRDLLVQCWTYKDSYTSTEIMPEGSKYQTLVALERRGLLENIRRHGWGGATAGSWRAEVTEEGRKLAEQLAQAG